MKPEAQIRTGLITVIFVLACQTLALLAELRAGALMSVSIGLIVTCIFIVYLQGILKKDAQIARRAYHTYFVILLFSSVFVLSDILDKSISVSTLVWIAYLGLAALTLFFLKIGINGLMQHPEAKNKSEKVKLLWWAFLPFIFAVLRMIVWIFSPLFPPLLRVIFNLD